MGVRVGVDVGGTFTKAVAFDLEAGQIVGQVVLPTSHADPAGVAAGVVDAVARLAAQVGADRIDLVTHSTTQAVNALLEGDVGSVGVIGLARQPDVAKARRRTMLKDVELAPGKPLRTLPSFFDVTDGLPVDAVRAELSRLVSAGASAVCVAEAFAPDDDSNEAAVAALAVESGLPVCAATELSGLYGLELRAVTAAINASILPIALRTAGYVEAGVAAAGIAAPVMVMRGDGGATDLDGFRSAPARTLYSGPAASVAGALRFAEISDGIIVEVGGTSTNVAAVRGGRPALSYVQVASHATALRSVDVRVVGVAGGSMLRARVRRSGKGDVYGVGPRSAHIAGLAYACFAPLADLAGAKAELLAPRPGDPADYVVVRTADGRALAVTNTCAANALGVTEPGDYAWTDPAAALAAFDLVGSLLGVTGAQVAEQMLTASGEAACELVDRLIRADDLRSPVIVAVGGGAGGLGRWVARMLGLECRVPDGAEVISSLGDALSHVRAERERTVDAITAEVVASLSAEVEAEVLAAGVAPASLEVQVEEIPERGTVRAVATGAIGLRSGAVPGRQAVSRDAVVAAAGRGAQVQEAGTYWVSARGDRLAILDRFAEPVAELRGEIVVWDELAGAYTRLTRYRGPVTLRPNVWVISGSRLVELASGDVVAAALALRDSATSQIVVVGRTR